MRARWCEYATTYAGTSRGRARGEKDERAWGVFRSGNLIRIGATVLVLQPPRDERFGSIPRLSCPYVWRARVTPARRRDLVGRFGSAKALCWVGSVACSLFRLCPLMFPSAAAVFLTFEFCPFVIGEALH